MVLEIKRFSETNLLRLSFIFFKRLFRFIEISILRKNYYLNKINTKYEVGQIDFSFSGNSQNNFISFCNIAYNNGKLFDNDILSENGLKINLLGEEIKIHYNINWSQCPKSKYIWANQFSFDLNPYQLSPNNVDVKYAWEINRLQFLLIYLTKYESTKDKQHLSAIEGFITKWITDNQFLNGINWCSELDVALRCISLIVTYVTIFNVDNMSVAFIEKLLSVIKLHLLYLTKFRSFNYHILLNNHCIGEETAIILGSFLFQGKQSERIRKKSVRILENLLSKIISEEGVYKEYSFNYERFAAEFLILLILFGKNKKEFLPNIPKFESYLTLIMKHLKEYSKPNGELPKSGDIDNGKVFYFDKNFNLSNSKEIIQLGSYVLGQSIDTKLDFISESKKNENNIKLFCGNNYENAYIFSRVGEFSNTAVSANTHSHVDLLSLEILINNMDIIVDKGVFSYFMDKQLFREQRACHSHNMLIINGEEIADNYKLFAYKNHPRCKVVEFNDNLLEPSFLGELAFKNNILRRKVSINFVEKRIDIMDTVQKCKQLMSAETLWYINPDLNNSVTVKDNKCLIRNDSLNMEFSFSGYEEVNILDDFVSPSYGKKKNAKVLHFISHNPNCRKFEIRINWN